MKTVKSIIRYKVTSTRIRTGGGSLDTSKFRYNQSPVETPNGVLTTFTLPNSESYLTGLVEVFINGNQALKGTEWTEDGGTLTTILFIGEFSTTPLTSDEKITLNYIKP